MRPVSGSGLPVSHTPGTAAIMLGMGSGVAGLVGAGLALALTRLGVSLPTLLALSAVAATLAGLMFALPLLARLGGLDQALAGLARGETAPAPARVWPLE